MRLITIAKIPEEIIEGSDYEKLNAANPYFVSHDGVNRIFNTVLPDAIDPILIDELTDEEGEKLTGDALLAKVAWVLFDPPRERVIHIPYGDLVALHASTTWKLWCGQYEDVEALDVDYLAVLGTNADAEKSVEENVEIAREALKTIFA